jgi:hypothetical protein
VNEPSLQSVLPASSREAISGEMSKDFQSVLKLPKGMNRHIIARAIDRVLLERKTVEELVGLVASERAYVSQVVVEFRAWEAANKAPVQTAPPAAAQETP